MNMVLPVCKMAGKCFARKDGRCEILMRTPVTTCSFQKPERDVTNGKRYEYRPETCKDASLASLRMHLRRWEELA